jgi:hypothetical protein
MMAGRARVLVAAAALSATALGGYPKMWVYNSYGMNTDEGWQSFSNMVVRAAAAGYNGVLTAAQLENAMNNWDKRARANYAKARDLCATLGMKIIPGVWGLGYGGPVCYWDPETVEATALKGATYVSDGKALRFEPQPVPAEAFSTADFGVRQVKAHLKPFTHYRITFKLKTENMLPDIYHKFRMSCWYKGGGSQLYDPPMKPTQDWTDVTFTFDTYDTGEMTFSAGKGRRDITGSYQMKDVRIEERGPCNVLTTDGMAPVVRDAATGFTYEAGRDYAPFPKMRRFIEQPDAKPIEVAVPAGSRIKVGARLLVDCWIPAVEGQRQYCGCPSAEQVYRYFEKSAREVEEFFHPKTWLLGIDEWRVANRCRRCQARNVSPAELMGECTARQYAIIRKVNPNAEIAAWADMFAPTDNARANYYCVKGDITGSWNFVPKDILMVVWENGHGPVAMKHFADNGFRTLAGIYYDHSDLENDRKWLKECNRTKGCQGLMYTTWQRKYGLLEDFAEMVKSGR